MTIIKNNVSDVLRADYANVLTRLSDPDEWKRFLEFAARLYKYDFNNQVLIYGQRPDATMGGGQENMGR